MVESLSIPQFYNDTEKKYEKCFFKISLAFIFSISLLNLAVVSAYAAPAKALSSAKGVVTTEEEVWIDTEKPYISTSAIKVVAEASQGENPKPRTISVYNSSGGKLSYKISADAAWLSVSPASGVSTGNRNPVSIAFNSALLQPGEHTASIKIEDPLAQNNPFALPVTLKVLRKTIIVLDASSMELTSRQGKDAAAKEFVIYNNGDKECHYSVKNDAKWLSPEPAEGVLASDEKKSVKIRYSTSDLDPGQYKAVIRVESPEASNGPQSIKQNLIVTEKRPLSVSAENISQKCLEGKRAEAQNFVLENTTQDKIPYRIAAYADWLSVNPAQGELGAGEQIPIAISYANNQLAEGDYSAEILVYQEGITKPLKIGVTLEVEAQPRIGLSAKEVQFKACQATTPEDQTLSVCNTGSGELLFNVRSNMPWLHAEPAEGKLAKYEEAEIKLSCDVTNMPIGEIRALLEFVSDQASNSPQNLPVTLTVKPRPEIKVTPLKFIAKAKEGDSPFPEPLILTNMGQEETECKISSNVEWLRFEPDSEKLAPKKPLSIKATYDTKSLASGDYSGTVTIAVGDGKAGAITVPVTLTVKGPELILSVESLSPSAAQGEDAEVGIFTIANTGGGTLKYELKPADKWISVSPLKGALKSDKEETIKVVYKTAELTKGKYSSSIEVTTDPAMKGAVKVPVNLEVKAKKSKKQTAASQMGTGKKISNATWEAKWEPSYDQSLFGDGHGGDSHNIPGPLQYLLMDKLGAQRSAYVNKSDYEYFTMGWQKEKTVKIKYQGYDNYSITIWTMSSLFAFYSPKDQWGGFDRSAFLREKVAGESYKDYKVMPPVKNADDSYVIRRHFTSRPPENDYDWWYFYVLKDGVVLRLDASTTPLTRQATGGQDINFYPIVEDIVNRISAKGWETLFKKGNPRYERLPDMLKPLIINKGMLSAESIFFGPPDRLGLTDTAQSWLSYNTETCYLADQPGYRCSVGMWFYHGQKKAVEEIENSVWKAQSKPLQNETSVPFPKGDKGCKITGNDSDYTRYWIKVGQVMLEFRYQNMNSKKFPEYSLELIDEIIDRIRGLNLNELFSSDLSYLDKIELEALPQAEEFTYDEEGPEAAGKQNEVPPSTAPAAAAAPVAPENVVQQENAYMPKPGDKSANGLIFSGAYNDWVKPQEYQAEQEQIQLGRTWQGDKWGWETPEETKARRENVRQFDIANDIADAKMHAELKEITDNIKRMKQEIREAEVKKEKTEILRKQLDNLEEQRKLDEEQSAWNSSEILENAVYSTARAAVTGVNADGSTSYTAIAGRMAAAIATAGYSEVAYNVADFGYRVNDDLKTGKPLSHAIAKAYGSMLKEEIVGRATGGILTVAAKGTYSGVKKLLGYGAGEAVSEAAKAEASLTKALAKKKDAIDVALKIEDPVTRTKAVVKLYENNGMKDFASLESKGALSVKQAAELNGVITKEVNSSVSQGVEKTVNKFQNMSMGKYIDPKTGKEAVLKVKVVEVLVGDSGSSAAKGGRSAFTDFDRTYVPKFDASDVRAYANAYHGGNLVAAQEALTNKFTNIQTKSVMDTMKDKGFTAKSVDYKSYSGFGGASGQKDSYAGGFVPTLQATKGSTTVFKVAEDGSVNSYKTSGRTIVDEHMKTQYELAKETSEAFTKEGKAIPKEIEIKSKPLVEAPKIAPQETPEIIGQQANAMTKDLVTAEKASKALLRADKITAVAKTQNIDPTLVEKARLVKQNPQDITKIIGDEAAQESFIKQIDDAIQKADQEIKTKYK